MSYKLRTNKAFTLIELLVAIGVLAIVLSFASVIFRVSIDTHRTAIANAEIMQKLRAITNQLNADFKGLRLDYGGHILFGFGYSKIDEKKVKVKSDNIIFFANGDFESTRQYGGRTVAGNIACIFYSLLDPNSYKSLRDPSYVPEPKEKILVRRQTVLTADNSLPDSDSDPRGEYYKKSLSQWRVEPAFSDPNDWLKQPLMNLNNLTEDDFVIYMAKGVDDFTIQYAQMDVTGKVQWLPIGEDVPGNIYNRAFKFTFKLYDSKDVIRHGRPFTHIVYLGN
jgi:prepilin-type N-terminal cleavage/methylation domain-containing protein